MISDLQIPEDKENKVLATVSKGRTTVRLSQEFYDLALDEQERIRKETGKRPKLGALVEAMARAGNTITDKLPIPVPVTFPKSEQNARVPEDSDPKRDLMHRRLDEVYDSGNAIVIEALDKNLLAFGLIGRASLGKTDSHAAAAPADDIHPPSSGVAEQAKGVVRRARGTVKHAEDSKTKRKTGRGNAGGN